MSNHYEPHVPKKWPILISYSHLVNLFVGHDHTPNVPCLNRSQAYPGLPTEETAGTHLPATSHGEQNMYYVL